MNRLLKILVHLAIVLFVAGCQSARPVHQVLDIGIRMEWQTEFLDTNCE